MSRQRLLGAVMAAAFFSPVVHATSAQSLHGGCYEAAPNVCRIHVDPFTIPVDVGAGERVAQFRINANNTSGGVSFTLWEFSTSSSYSFKPVGDFSPRIPREHFHAVCGETYTLNILTRGDTAASTGSFGNAGVTAEFRCPVAVLLTRIFADGFDN